MGSLDRIKLEPTYPHRMLINLGRLVKNDVSLLKDSAKLLGMYKMEYPDDIEEYNLLKLADKEGILKKFQENMKDEKWKKRVCVKVAFNILMQYTSINASIVIIESLMHMYHYDISVYIELNSKDDNIKDFHQNVNKNSFEKNYNFQFSKEIENEVREKEELFDKKTDDIIKTRFDNQVINNVSENLGSDSLSDIKATHKIKHNKIDKIQDAISDNKKIEVEQKRKKLSECVFYNKMNITQRKILKKAVNSNDKISQCDMGDYYSEDGSSHIDYNEARKMYSLSADQGYARALLGLGRMYDQHPQDINDKNKAIHIYIKLAEQGVSTAQYILGMKYRFADGVEEDVQKAIKWFLKSAQQGNVQAICSLADTYQSVYDNENALKWFRIGALRGSDYCKRKLGG